MAGTMSYPIAFRLLIVAIAAMLLTQTAEAQQLNPAQPLTATSMLNQRLSPNGTETLSWSRQMPLLIARDLSFVELRGGEVVIYPSSIAAATSVQRLIRVN
jgi:hypothetical protein